MEQRATAIFAKGCFWDVESYFTNIQGIFSTQCGYTGGFIPHPSHMEITSGKTGHVHAVEIKFYPEIISYEELLDIYISIPFTPSAQTPHFQPIIFYTNEDQKRVAHNKIQTLSLPISIKNASTFYPASDFHQHYWKKNSLSKQASTLP